MTLCLEAMVCLHIVSISETLRKAETHSYWMGSSAYVRKVSHWSGSISYWRLFEVHKISVVAIHLSVLDNSNWPHTEPSCWLESFLKQCEDINWFRNILVSTGHKSHKLHLQESSIDRHKLDSEREKRNFKFKIS